MDKKTLLIAVLVVIVGVLLVQVYRQSEELSDYMVRQANFKVCLNAVKDGRIDARHKKLETVEECSDFYLNTSTKILIEEYN